VLYLGLQDVRCVIKRERRLVGPWAEQRVADIGKLDNLGEKRDLRVGEAVGVAAPVQAFVVSSRNGKYRVEPRQFFTEPLAEMDVLRHDVALSLAEGTRFVEDRGGN
jgi:hypothetical protein